MKKQTKYIVAITAMAAAVLIPTVACYAGAWVPKWGIDANASYDDNFFMNEAEQETWRYSVKPELSLNYLTPAIESSLEIELAVNRYSEFEEFDSEDPWIHWDNTFSGERATWTLNLGYKENSQRDFAELDTGQFDSNTVVETISIQPGVSYQLTENDSISLSFDRQERTYDDVDFSDNENDSIRLGWQHQINQRWTTDVSTTVSQYQAERVAVNQTETDYENLTAGVIYQASQAMTINISLGYFNSDEHRVVLSGPMVVVRDTENSGALATVGFVSDTPINDWSITLSRGLYPSSQGEVEERDSVNLFYERKLSERSTTGIRAEWIETDSELSPRENTSISPFYNYRLSPRLRLDTSYQFRSFDRELGEVESSRIKAGLRYSF